MKCQNKDKETNMYCEGKARGIINGIIVCGYCFYKIKKTNKEKENE